MDAVLCIVEQMPHFTPGYNVVEGTVIPTYLLTKFVQASETRDTTQIKNVYANKMLYLKNAMI